MTLWCDGSKTILQKRQYTNPNDETYFEKSWKEYKDGFEKTASNIWMGLGEKNSPNTLFEKSNFCPEIQF